jgi:hypothetical protein
MQSNVAALLLVVLISTITSAGTENRDSTAPENPSVAEQYAALQRADQYPEQKRQVYTKVQLHGLQLALMRWSVDNSREFGVPGGPLPTAFAGFFPDSLASLVMEGYITPGFYPNAYSGDPEAKWNALNVPFGWSEIAPGNFTYLKHYNAEGRVDDHILVGYGPSADGGTDVDGDGRLDGAIITLASTNWTLQPDAPLEVTRDFWTDHGQRISITQINHKLTQPVTTD